jgi:predicted nucleic acid-binding Zn ribbon protein
MNDTSPAPSGVDMARAALAAARANAKHTPTQPKKTIRNRRVARTGGRDPIGLASAITGMISERGWEPPETGGSILDQWATIAPELADKVHAERFEHDTGILHLRPVSPAYATQLRMFQSQTLRRIHDKTGDRSVRALKILSPGAPTAPSDTAAPEGKASPEPAPARTRDDGCSGYQETLTLALTHRPERAPTDPYLLRAMARQERALRASRPSESEHREAVWEEDRLEQEERRRSEAVRLAAIARKRAEGPSVQTPRRLFGAA